jgi:hypothetical protein
MAARLDRQVRSRFTLSAAMAIAGFCAVAWLMGCLYVHLWSPL